MIIKRKNHNYHINYEENKKDVLDNIVYFFIFDYFI